jgi:hypothetical protein
MPLSTTWSLHPLLLPRHQSATSTPHSLHPKPMPLQLSQTSLDIEDI